MNLVKLTTTTFLLCFFAMSIHSNAQAQLLEKKVESRIGELATVNSDLVTSEFMIYQQGNIAHIVDLSTGPISNRIWEMGDGSYQYDKVFFSHTYKERGLHKICLRVQGPMNSSLECHKVIIK